VVDDKAPTPIPKLGHVSSSCWSVEYNNPFSIAILKDGKKQIGKKLIAVCPLKDISVPVEVVSSHYVDPKGERVRS
jgi:glycine cleavage system aminomethyltransferase T